MAGANLRLPPVWPLLRQVGPIEGPDFQGNQENPLETGQSEEGPSVQAATAPWPATSTRSGVLLSL